jgi:sigma-B regulation protein RsbU (phosphoserine phosphatase)
MSVTELLGGAIGTTLLGLGGASVIAWSMRRRAPERVLLYFGLWCSLYGARLIAEQSSIVDVIGGSMRTWSYWRVFATYAINVPIGLFLEGLIGPGWKHSVRRVWQVQAVYAAGAIGTDLALGRPAAAMPINSPLVLLTVAIGLANVWIFRDRLSRTFRAPVIGVGGITALVLVTNENLGRPLIPAINLEPLGFFAFVAALGYGVVVSVFRQEAELVAVQRELDTARQIQTALLPRVIPHAPGLDIAARYVPMSAVAGDLYDVVRVGPSHVGILVADVSGHGVPAALVASMVKLAFSTQADHAHDPACVLSAMNRLLCRHLEGTFVTAIYAVIDTERRAITIGNAGHPALLVGRADSTVEESTERGVMLGVFPDAMYSNGRLDLRDGDRILAYTDGISEAQTRDGEFLDTGRIRAWLSTMSGDAAAPCADAVLHRLEAWRGGPTFDDDVTFVIARFTAALQ